MSAITVQHLGSAAVITLNDPRRRNALNLDMNSEICAALDRCEADGEISAVVITGEPPAFCAGADLGQLGESRRDGLLAIYEGFLRIASCPLPTIAAVNGPAVGAGMNLALACDLRIAGTSARFDTRFLTLGIHPGGGHTWMLTRAGGVQTTMATVLFGEVLSAEEAKRTGIIWQVTDDEALLATAVELAQHAGRGGRELAIRTKATIRRTAALPDHAAGVADELETQLWSMDQPAFAELLRAMQARISTKDRSAGE